MNKRAAIIGLGGRGQAWATTFLDAGWTVTGFDPEPLTNLPTGTGSRWKQETTISASVRDADWIAICLPERLELLQKVMQRAQAEAPKTAVVGVATTAFNIEEVQNCALRSDAVVIVSSGAKGGFTCDVSPKTSDGTRDRAKQTLAGLMTSGLTNENSPQNIFQASDAKSA